MFKDYLNRMRTLLIACALLLWGGMLSAQSSDYIRYYPPAGLSQLSAGASGITSTVPLLLPSGSKAAPSLKFSSEANASGWYYRAVPDTWSYASMGVVNYELTGAGVKHSSVGYECWASGFLDAQNCDTSFYRRAAGALIVGGGVSFPTNIPGALGVSGGYSSYSESGAMTEEITLSTSGTTTDSAANLLPANAYIDGVAIRITTGITGAGVTTITVGDGTDGARFKTGMTLTLADTAIGLEHLDQTGANGPIQASAAKLRITAVGATPTAGKVRVIVYYRLWTIPAS